MYKIILGIIFTGILSTNIFSQNLDQELTVSQGNNISTQSFSNLNQNSIFKSFPNGLSSLLSIPDSIEELEFGYTTVFVPKGYGKTIHHYGIWNAIPFVVFDNNSLELRFGLIFEHRQNGFIPDEWINTSITGENLPTIEFLIPNIKTFLNFSHGASQWRATVLLTEDQLQKLNQYINSNVEIFTINHRFIDSSLRPYLIGLRHKAFFQMMLLLYRHIEKLPQIKKFQGSDTFPEGAFFEELNVDYATTDTNEENPTENTEYNDVTDNAEYSDVTENTEYSDVTENTEYSDVTDNEEYDEATYDEEYNN